MPTENRTRRAPTPIAWMDGRVVPAADATIPLMDEGFLRGDAVFDSILVRRGRTHALDLHLERLRASARAMNIRVPVLRKAIADLLAAWGERDGALKIIVTRGGAVRGIVQAVSWPASVSLHVVEIPWRSALSGVKTLSYAVNQWAFREALQHHADDALIVEDGEVRELPTGSLCVVTNGVVVSPDPKTAPILDSVTVRELSRVVDVERRTPSLGEVLRADELFVVSATRPVLPVHAVDDVELAAPGPLTDEVQQRFLDHIDASLDPLP